MDRSYNDHIISNGELIRSGKVHVSVNDRSFRYGDGCFETMHYRNGELLLAEFHFERLFTTLQALYYDIPRTFSPSSLKEQMTRLVEQNGHQNAARIRLTIHRGEGGLYDETDHRPQFLIQSWPLSSTTQLNSNGLHAGVFPLARKQSDHFSSLKSNNYQPYVLGAIWAKNNKLNEALILNTNDRIADATIANVFIVKDGTLITPPLSEGCIAGVMRKYLIGQCKKEGFPIQEAIITTDDLANANEVFLTNAISGIRWVGRVDKNEYTSDTARMLYERYIRPLFNP